MGTETKTSVAWRWCCQQPHFTRQQLQQAAEIGRRYTNNVIAKWVGAGVIERIPSTSIPAFYRVINPQQAPVLGTGSNQKGRLNPRCRQHRKTQQQKMWNSMKISRTFGLSDLMITSYVSRRTAYAYVEHLAKAGYIKVLNRQPRHLPFEERAPSRYQLVRDTGRRTPIVRQNGCWDQNEQLLYPYETKCEGDSHVA